MTEFSVRTPSREILVDITEEVRRVVASAGDFDGLAHIYVPHTTAGVTINEGADPDVARDIVDTLSRLVPAGSGYRHREGNADSHVKAGLMGSQTAVPVSGGRLQLGTWQAIYLAEFDGPRTRRVWVTLTAAR